MRPYRYLIELRYSGSAYHGWQSQPRGLSVQNAVERVLWEVLPGAGRLTAASRTDRGVHAEQQFAAFRSHASIASESDFVTMMNRGLPTDIHVTGVRVIGEDFHPSVSAKSKVYRYRLWFESYRGSEIEGARQDQLAGHWRRYRPVDVSRLKEELASIVGTHDFTTFSAADGDAGSFVRTIYGAWVEEEGCAVTLWFHGSGFLKQMIRMIVSSALSLSESQAKAKPLLGLISAADRKLSPRSAPAHGLSLMEVRYS